MKNFSSPGVGIATCVLLLVACCDRTVVVAQDAKTVSLEHRVVMDPKAEYTMSWTAEEDTIVMELQAATQGYVGVGFSPTGGMKGADIILGWVDDNDQPQILDMHGVGNRAPVVDASQDVELVNGWRNDSHTTLRFRRPWDTCDQQEDYLLSGDTVKVIYAFGEKTPDPDSNSFPYHLTRGTKNLHLQEYTVAVNEFGDDVKTWDLVASPIMLPTHLDTVYWCNIIKRPEQMKHSYYIGFKPQIPERIAAFVHHLIIYECRIESSSKHMEEWVDHQGHQCYSPNMPISWKSCSSPLAGWAVGSDGMFLPPHIATPVGEEHGGATYFLFEVHYDNPNKVSAYMEGTALRIYYTHTPREFNTGGLTFGANVIPSHIIGPSNNDWQSAGFCDSDCTKKDIPSEGIKLVGGFMHTHLLGHSLKLQHIRDGKELPPILEDKHYDFNYQQQRFMKEERLVLPGDTLKVTCGYNTSQKVSPIFGGLGTSEEMCLVFMIYYPRSDVTGCVSEPNFDGILESLGIEDYEMDFGDQLNGYNKGKKMEKDGENKNGQYMDLKEEEMIEKSENLVDIKLYYAFNSITIKKPFALQNMTLLQLLQERSLWQNHKFVAAFQEHMIRGTYRPICLSKKNDTIQRKKLGVHEFPKYEPYVPPPTKCMKTAAAAKERPVNPKLELKPKSKGK